MTAGERLNRKEQDNQGHVTQEGKRGLGRYKKRDTWSWDETSSAVRGTQEDKVDQAEEEEGDMCLQK